MEAMKKDKSRGLKVAVVLFCIGLLGYAGFLCYVSARIRGNTNEESAPMMTSRAEVCSMKVTAKGVIPDGYSLKLKEIVDDNSALKASSLMSEDVKAIGSYDINISNEDNKEYQPKKDKRSITLFVEDERFKEFDDIEVCHISDNGKAEMMDAVRVRDDAIVLKTDSFSTYVFGGKTVETEGEKAAAYLKTGLEINTALRTLADPSAQVCTESGGRINIPEEMNVTAIVWDESPFTSQTELQAEGEPVYARYAGGVIYIYTAADKMYFNADSSAIFAGFKNAAKITIPYDPENPDKADTSLIENARQMFSGDTLLESLGKDDAGNEIGVAYWDMSGTENISEMFSECQSLLFDCAYWNTENVKDGSYFAYNCTSLFTMDISGWKTDNLTKVTSMFEGCENMQALVLSEEGNLETKGEKVESYASFLKGCNKLKSIDLSNWDITAGTDFTGMLDCSGLTKIVSPKKVTDASIRMSNKTWYIDDDGDYAPDNDGDYECLNPDTASHTYRIVELDYAMFEDGMTFNQAIKKLSGQSNATYTSSNTYIKDIVWTTENISDKYGVIRVDSMGAPIYAEYNSGVIKIYTTAETVYLNPDSVFMFAALTGIKELPFVEDERLDTSRVTNIAYMFGNATALTRLDLSGWDTSNVVQLSQMFVSCTKLTSLNVSTWDTSNVKYIDYTFANCPMLTELDLSNWDTSSVVTFDTLFYKDAKLKTVDVSNWDTSNVTTIEYAFYGCKGLEELDVSGWNTENLTSMESAFTDCQVLKKLDVTGWKTPKLTNLKWAFQNCYKLSDIDPSQWDTSNVTTLAYTFDACKAIPRLDLSKWDTSKVESLAHTFRNCNALITLDVSGWNTGNVTDMTATFEGCGFTTTDISEWNTENVQKMGYLFYNCANLTTLEVPNWDTGNVTTLEYAFAECHNLATLDLSEWDVKNVTSLGHTFTTCKNLVNPHIDKWKTPKVTTMYCMFYACYSLNGINLSEWETGSLTNMDAMFQLCNRLEELDLSNWDVSKVTTIHNTFRDCQKLKTLHLEEWNTESLETMEAAFHQCYALESLDLSKWNTKKVKSFGDAFNGCTGLIYLDLSGWEVDDNASIINPIYRCDALMVVKAPKKLGEIHVISLPCRGGYWHIDENENMTVDGNEDTKVYSNLVSVEDHSYTYLKNGVQRSPDGKEYDYAVLLPGRQFFEAMGFTQQSSYYVEWTDEDISQNPRAVRVECEGAPVYGIKLSDGKTHVLYTEAQKVYLNDNCAWMFNTMRQLRSVDFLLDKRVDSSRVKSLRAMFVNCENITSLDLSSLDVSEVRSFYDMFIYCSRLTDLDLSNWNVEKAQTLDRMFYACKALKTLDLSGWNPKSAKSLNNMFQDCSALEVLDIAEWDTGNITNADYAFLNCKSLTYLDLSGWNTKNLTSAYQMFGNCTALTGIDVADWNTEKLGNAELMFENCSSLATLDISKWNSVNLTNDNYMFKNCSSLTYLDFSGWDMRNSNMNKDTFTGCTKLCKVKSPHYTKWNTPTFPGGRWGMDDNEDGIFDSTTTYVAWEWEKYESHIYIKGTLNVVNFVILESDETIPSQVFLTADSSAKVVEPTLKKVGYMLDGWYTDKNCTQRFDSTQAVTESMTLYARWDRPTFTITFDPNGGILTGARSKTVTYGNQYGGLPSAEKEFAFFNGWMTPSGQLINSRNIVLLGTDTVLTASWTDTEVFYTVTFETNGGTQVPSQNVSSGKTAVKPGSVREGYILTNWYSDEALNNVWNFETDAVDCDMTLYAGWKRDTITVTFNTAGGLFSDGTRIKSVEIESGNTITVPDTPTRERYTFMGWSEDGENMYDMAATPENDLTLYAVWDMSVFTVTLDANGGMFNDKEQIHTIEVSKGDAVGDIEAPTKQNYSFKGWYSGSDLWSTSSAVNKNMTVIAVWELVENTDSDKLVISYKEHEWQDKKNP